MFNDGILVEEMQLVSLGVTKAIETDSESNQFATHVAEYRTLKDSWLNAICAALMRGFDARSQGYRMPFSPLSQVTSISSSLVKNVTKLPLNYRRLGVLKRNARKDAEPTKALEPSSEEKTQSLHAAQVLATELPLKHMAYIVYLRWALTSGALESATGFAPDRVM